MPSTNSNPKAKAAKIIAIIAFCLVFSALAFAIISDVIVFAQQIIMFIVACFAAVALLIIGFILMIVSIVFVFGIYLLEEYGFWPINWAFDGFNEVLADAAFTSEQAQLLVAIRIILVICCVVGFVLSIVALSLKKSAEKDGYQEKQKLTKSFGVLSLIFSILGFFMGIFVLIIAAAAF